MASKRSTSFSALALIVTTVLTSAQIRPQKERISEPQKSEEYERQHDDRKEVGKNVENSYGNHCTGTQCGTENRAQRKGCHQHQGDNQGPRLSPFPVRRHQFNGQAALLFLSRPPAPR